MRILTNLNNVDSASADFPNGKVRDRIGAVPGTDYVEGLHGDIIQFFQKLMIESGTTSNDLPDNVTNGYQLIEALRATVYQNNGHFVVANTDLTNTEQDLMTFVPFPNHSFNNVETYFNIKHVHNTSGSNTSMNWRLYVGGILRRNWTTTVFADGRSNMINLIGEDLYSAGDIVKITGWVDVDNGATVQTGSLLCNAHNGNL